MKKEDILVQRRRPRMAIAIGTVDPAVVVLRHSKSVYTVRVPWTEAVELCARLKGLKAEWASQRQGEPPSISPGNIGYLRRYGLGDLVLPRSFMTIPSKHTEL
jgi:hypothetical protein